MIPALILQLVLWTSSASAFYPYTPAWLKEKEEVALLGEAKRNAASSSANEDGVAFIIEQRQDFEENAESPAQRAAKQAAWLKSKYSHIRGEVPAMRHENLHKRSGNTYPVMKAAEPTKSNAAGINQDGTDYSYFIKARLGSKKKELYLLLDTGAGSSWVMGSSCTEKACTLHNNFGHDDSDTLIDKKKSFSISYGTGTVQGDLASDTVTVGGFSVQYTFGLASKTSDDFTHFAFDGILGMSMSQGVSDNFLSTIADGKKLEKNIFGVALSRAADGHNTGEVRFGAINPDKYQGDITYTAVDSTKDGDWSIPIEDMAYGRRKAGNGGVLAYIDTGTSFVFGPADKVKKLHAVIPGSSSGDGMTFIVPCDSSDDLTFTFSGVNYKLSPKDWISPKDNNGKCTSNIYGHEVVEGAWLLGDTFLKNVYTVFDRDQGRIGFAAAASPSEISPTVSPASSEDSGAKATAGPSTGTATTLATMATPSGSSQSKELPLGLSGHETVAIGATGSGTATATPTQSSTSAATALVRSSQYAQMAAAMFSVTVLVLAV